MGRNVGWMVVMLEVGAFGAVLGGCDTPPGESTGVCRAHPQPLQRDHRGGCLAAGGLFVFLEASLCIKVRVMRHDDQMIDGV